MANKHEENISRGGNISREGKETYYIPANFIETGTVLGGMLKLRNVIEAGAVLVATGLPVIKLPLELTPKIVVACLTVLPLCLLTIIGVGGESLSSFIIGFLKFLKNRRVLGKKQPPNKGTRREQHAKDVRHRTKKRGFVQRSVNKTPKKRTVDEFFSDSEYLEHQAKLSETDNTAAEAAMEIFSSVNTVRRQSLQQFAYNSGHIQFKGVQETRTWRF